MDDEELQPARRRPWLRGWRILAAALLVLIAGAFIILWSIRVQLASDYVDRELARRGVQASYEVKRIGFGTQIFENLVIGDPRRPDATAREVRIQILLGLTGPRVGLISARGVRMRGRLADGVITLGDVDKLLPPPSELPFRLPDQRVDVADAAILLDTPAGRLALGLAGRGNLADGFRGNLALASHELRLGECAIRRPRADVAVAVDDLRPRLRGPAAVAALRCDDDLAVDAARFALDARLEPAFDGWRGATAVRAARFAAGPHNMAAIGGRLGFAGDAGRTAGRIELGAAATAVERFRAERTRFAGLYEVSPRRGDLTLSGEVAAEAVTLEARALAGLAGAFRSADGTPVGPIGAALADALTRAGRGGAEASARLQLASRGGRGAVRFDRLRLAARSGARFAGDRVTYGWPGGALQLDGEFALTGGGFPDARFTLRQPAPGAPVEGVGRIAPLQAGGARLELAEIRFAADPSGRTRFATALRVDGPIGDGEVRALALPVRGRFGPDGLAIGEGCVTAAFQALRVEGLRIGAARLPLCPIGPGLVWQRRGGPVRAGAELRAPRLAGRLGQTPVRLAAGRLRVDTDGFSASGVAALLGPQDAATRFDIASVSARFVPRGVAGAYAGLAGEIAGVPLLLSEGAGRWQVLRGDLEMVGGLRIADARDPPRFHPLVSDDFRLTLVDNLIRATGWLRHPATGTPVTQASVEHHLRTGAGHAVLDVPSLAFGPGLQPEQLTPLTVGVVALVEGTVYGRGRIEWDVEATRSTGSFATDDMDFAAPFGPVEGLATRIEFTDLLGLVSAPGQVAEIGLVRAGIDVYDGTLRYQLRPDYHVRIENGRWPFAGGELILEPTLLDFSQPSTHYLTFRVVGLDAARFVQRMEFSNISATGTFDGVVPMQFDQRGGRVVGGRLAARPPGGTLSYIGELTDRDLGVYGKMAFDALKALRYDRFDISLDGALDGEFITFIELDGVARDPTAPLRVPGGAIGQALAGRALSQLARIPFEFNIRIQGPFRALIATARSFDDPSLLLSAELPRLLRARQATDPDVQDEESEDEP